MAKTTWISPKISLAFYTPSDRDECPTEDAAFEKRRERARQICKRNRRRHNAAKVPRRKTGCHADARNVAAIADSAREPREHLAADIVDRTAELRRLKRLGAEVDLAAR